MFKGSKPVGLYWLAMIVLSSTSFAAKVCKTSFSNKNTIEFALNAISHSISREDTPKGFVIASPSRDNPDYYFHWVRDAALVMEQVRQNPHSKFNVKGMFEDYFLLEEKHQKVFKLKDQGEPKFTRFGESFQGPWGRPQNDGPALRSMVMSRYVLNLLERDPNSRSWVESFLYRAELPAETVIKRDLEYVSHHWHEPDFDLWEEIRGEHYYTRLVQRASMLLGSILAQKMGDFKASHWYELQAQRMEVTLENFWSEMDGQIISTINRTEGLDYKYSGLDSSAILAINHVWDVMPPSETGIDRTLSTLEKLINEFRVIYPLSHDGGAVPLGRYPEDTYFGGNPWFLLNSAVTEFIYRVLSRSLEKREFWVSMTNVSFLKNILKLNVEPGELLSHERFGSFESAMIKLAERYTQRVEKHMGSGGRLDEQFHRGSGFMTGAPELTWSYAAYISASTQKNIFFSKRGF